MCGIFGVHGRADAAHLVQRGLYALQHRGQESAGIAAADEHHAFAVKRMGLVGEGLRPDELAALAGPVAIGHTRYSTAGSSTLENAQPVLARSRGGHIALAHNGNLTNAAELRFELEEQGAIFQSTMDSEVVVHRIARASPEGAPEDRVAAALEGVEGAYCLLIVIGEALVAARDPRGWRPFVMGRLGDSMVFASETCALDIVGATLVREIQPGEIFVVDADGERSIYPFAKQELKRCVFEHVYFARPDSRIFGGSVDRARRALGRRLAREAPAPAADLVFSVPDSSNSAALGYAEEAGIPYELALIRNHYVGRTFIQPNQDERDLKVKVKYNAVREVLDGQSVVMVDDSIVRGTTTRGLISLVRAAGAREVHMRVSSSPVTGPCYYGIDTPSRDELIAAQMSIDEIATAIGADSLGYLPLDAMLESVPTGPEGFCHACFSGDYPTPPPTDPVKLREGCGC